MRLLEQLLHFFHVSCQAAVAALGGEMEQARFLANVDITAADAFAKHKTSQLQQQAMRAKTWRLLVQLEKESKIKAPLPAHRWLLKAQWEQDFQAAEDAEALKPKTGAKQLERHNPAVIVFDEAKGVALNHHELEADKAAETRDDVPWTTWMDAKHVRAMGRDRALAGARG